MFTLAFIGFMLIGLLAFLLPIFLNRYLPLWHLRGYARGISQAVKTEVQRQRFGAQRLYASLALRAVF